MAAQGAPVGGRRKAAENQDMNILGIMRMNRIVQSMLTSLDALGLNASATISAIAGEPRLRRRLLELGLVPGVVVKVLRRAPLGDPLVIQVRGYDLSLRKSEAAVVEVQP
jgi:ferrous iron transport protein A